MIVLKKIDLTGQRFGRLVVVNQAETIRRGKTRWRCLCDCGKTVDVYAYNLRNGNSKSCGCLNREHLLQSHVTHGMSNTRLYKTWCDMKARCSYPKDDSYPIYGGRGITVCRDWQNDFSAFSEWALANGYRDDLTIDRIDPDGNYEPGNCRWATTAEQANNKRSNRLLAHDGRTMTIAGWAREIGIPAPVISARLRYGWSSERALTQPMRKLPRRKKTC